MSRKRDIAREAARLLYYHKVKEYKEAKLEASKSLGLSALPSNFEVVLELDSLADEIEGEERKEHLIRLREEALKLMLFLIRFHPRLFGSVWRGTARKGSDIDIQVQSSRKEEIIEKLEEQYEIIRAEWTEKTAGGHTDRFFHIFVTLPKDNQAEVCVKSLDEDKTRIDAIYGDEVRGLDAIELKEILEKNPLRKFIPERKKRRVTKK